MARVQSEDGLMDILTHEMQSNPIAIHYEAMEDLLVIGDWGFEVSMLFENNWETITCLDSDLWPTICNEVDNLDSCSKQNWI